MNPEWRMADNLAAARQVGRGEYRRRYDEIAAHHLKHYREHGVNPWMSQEPQLRAWAVSKVQQWVPVGARVLDAGCGIGLMLGNLTATYDAVGVDVSAEYVDHAKGNGLDARVGWLDKLHFKNAEFDAVVCCDVLEHVQDPDAVVREFRRVTRADGVLVVRVPDGDNTGVGADGGFGFPVHLQQWDASTLAAFLGGLLLGSEVRDNELVMAVKL